MGQQAKGAGGNGRRGGGEDTSRRDRIDAADELGVDQLALFVRLDKAQCFGRCDQGQGSGD